MTGGRGEAHTLHEEANWGRNWGRDWVSELGTLEHCGDRVQKRLAVPDEPKQSADIQGLGDSTMCSFAPHKDISDLTMDNQNVV